MVGKPPQLGLSEGIPRSGALGGRSNRLEIGLVFTLSFRMKALKRVLRMIRAKTAGA
jgi:hypothetical protein